MDSIDTEVSAALDALAIAVSNARESGSADGWISAISLAYSDLFDAIVKRSASTMGSALVHERVREGSPTARAATAAGREAISAAVEDFYKILAASTVVSARLLERLTVATHTDPDEILRSIAQETHDVEGGD